MPASCRAAKNARDQHASAQGLRGSQSKTTHKILCKQAGTFAFNETQLL
jgi:hypothetical protein